jgi:predicted phage terminase large subunit-like protein
MVVAGVGVDGRGYVLADRSCRLSPDGWARRAVQAYDDFDADAIVAEVNNGGDLVEQTIRTVRRTVPYIKVHASRGKQTRAQPVAALYEQGKVSHTDAFPELEEQLTSWTPESGASPDRLDALVWALTYLMLGEHRQVYVY